MRAMNSTRDVNINIRDNRGLATLIGFVAVLVLTRLWWTGILSDMFATVYSPKGEGMTSVSYTVVAFAANLVYGLGTVIVMAWSGLWLVVMDIFDGFRQWAAERKAKGEVTDAAVVNAVAIETADGTGPEPFDLALALTTIDVNIRNLNAEIESVAGKFDVLEQRVAAIESTPKPRTTSRTTKK